MGSIDWQVAAIHAACYVVAVASMIGVAWAMQRIDQRKGGQ